MRDPGCDDDMVTVADVLLEGRQLQILGLPSPQIDRCAGPLRVVRSIESSTRSARDLIAEQGLAMVRLIDAAWERGDTRAAALYERQAERFRAAWKAAR